MCFQSKLFYFQSFYTVLHTPKIICFLIIENFPHARCKFFKQNKE